MLYLLKEFSIFIDHRAAAEIALELMHAATLCSWFCKIYSFVRNRASDGFPHFNHSDSHCLRSQGAKLLYGAMCRKFILVPYGRFSAVKQTDLSHFSACRGVKTITPILTGCVCTRFSSLCTEATYYHYSVRGSFSCERESKAHH